MPRTFTITRRVQFAETDMAGVMHFANYLRWMEEVEHAYFRSLGLSVMQPHDGRETGWPRVHVSCEYFAPARFEDQVEVRLNVTDLTDKSMTYEATFWIDERRIARGRVKAVCCAMTDEGFRSIPIPASVRPAIEAP